MELTSHPKKPRDTPLTFRCAIIGEGSLPLECARALLDRGHAILGVVSADADFRGWAADLDIPCAASGVGCWDVLAGRPFDYLFSIVNHRVLEPEILALPGECAINYHDGPLPRYGGIHATSWAIMGGEKTHGVTWHVMAERVDAGDILVQPTFPIAERETALTLNAKCYDAALASFGALVEMLERGTADRQPQNPSVRSFFGRYRRPAAACVLSWDRTAVEIDAFVRALDFGRYPNPLGVAKILIAGDFFIVRTAEARELASAAPPGTITGVGSDSLTVATPSGEIVLRDLFTPEGRPVSISSLVESRGLTTGQMLPELAPDLADRLGACYERSARSESFWVERLSNLRPPEFPYVQPVGSGQADYCRVPFPAGDAVGAFLQRLPSGCSCTEGVAAAFHAYVLRLTGSGVVTLGVSDEGLRTELAGLEGLFATHRPITIEADGETRFDEFATALRRELKQAETHAAFARDVVTRYPTLVRSGATPDLPLHIIISEGASLTPPNGCALALEIDERSGTLSWLYDRARISSQSVARVTVQFTTLLGAIVEDLTSRIRHLPLLREEERRQVLGWNVTVGEYSTERCLDKLFEQQVERTPEAIAIVFEHQQLTYAELNSHANRLAHSLQALGVGPDTRVGLCLERSPELVIGVLGILKAGGAYLPLDLSYPRERLAFMLRDARTSVVVTCRSLRDNVPADDARLICVDDERALSSDDANPRSATVAGNLSYVIYTSGSTGTPKGALITHANVTRLMAATQDWFRFDERDVWTLFHSVAFDFSVWELWGALLYGGRLVVVPFGVSRSPEAFYQLLREERVTVLNQTPSAFRQLLAALPAAAPRQLAVRKVIFGGEALEPVTLARWFDLYGWDDGRLVNMYGITETTVHVTCRPLRHADLAEGRRSVIGGAIPDLSLYLLGPSMQPVPVGVAGEIYVGGAGLARGYLNRPELTAERFVPDPYSGEEGARLYRSGDLARYLPGGELEYLGRIDHQVKIRGFRIELGEIERALTQCPGVREAVALCREEVPGEKRLVAYVVLRDDTRSTSELREHLKRILPEYMLPSAFVSLKALPLTANGKLDRTALPAPHAAGSEGVCAVPRTPFEEALAGIWSALLRVERIGVHDSFFELGGHSLLATQLVSRIRGTFQVELPVLAIFEAPTIAELADRLAAARGDEAATAPPVARISREEPISLSFAQQRLWFLDQLQPGSAAYNIPIVFRLTGPLDVPALEQSVDELLRRHEALRTTFTVVDGVPHQVIHPPLALPLPVIDVRGLPEAAPEVAAQRLAREEAAQPFDLERGPLLRCSLARLGDEEHFFLLTIHHIVSDDWSIGVITRELSALYNAYRESQPSPLAEPALQYADFAAWQREWLQRDVLERQLAYWKQHLAGAPTLLELPADRPRPAVQSFRGAVTRTEIQGELLEALRSLGQQLGITLFMTLMTAFQAMLHRYTGQNELVVGTTIANRGRSEVEGVVGLFLNTLGIRGDVSGDPTFRELSARVREAALGAYAHQDLPFDRLVEKLQLERRLSHAPIFQVAISIQQASQRALALRGLRAEPCPAATVSAKVDLLLDVTEAADGLSLRLEYNTDLFDQERMERLLGHFRTLLEGIIVDPDQRISRLPVLTEAERFRLLAAWNETSAEYARDLCIHQLFEQQVERIPDAVALEFEGQSLTYAQLNARANQLAHFLRRQGVGPETLVGLCVERSVEMVVGLLGILKAGGAYLPLDPSYPPERLAFMLEDSGARVLLTQASCRERLVQCSGESGDGNQCRPRPLRGVPSSRGRPSPRSRASSALRESSHTQYLRNAELASLPQQVVLLDRDRQQIADQSEENPPGGVMPENLAYVIYTSGSTGRPKGAAVPHRGLCNVAAAQMQTLGIQPSSRVLQFASLSFDASIFEIVMALGSGSTLCLGSSEQLMPGPDLARFLREAAITTVTLPPSALTATEVEALPELRTITVAGEACPAELVARWGVGRRFYNLYGPTESTIWASYSECFPQGGKPLIGRPIANTQLYLLDRHFEPVPVGVPGELYIGGAGVARGYLNQPALTAEKFVPDPFSGEAGGRLYRTGDLARYTSKGELEFLGRIDHQVKVRGFRIELGEIESALAQYAGVREAVALSREDAPGEQRLVAYVVPSNGVLSASELREHLKEKLPEYMVPSAFVTLEALPLSSNGKVDRRALPAPDGTRPELESAYEAPRTETEAALAAIWAEVLRVERVGIRDNFFELGGHSLLATQLVSRIRTALGVELPLRFVFTAPTLAALAERLAGAEAEARPERVDLEALLAELETLPEAEVEARLAGLV